MGILSSLDFILEVTALVQFKSFAFLAIVATSMIEIAPTVLAQQLTNIGFVRQQGQPAVYYQYSDTHYCHVQNDVQMAAFGGASQVRVTNNIHLRGQFTRNCGWPNGFFRRSTEPQVYMMYGNSFIPNLGESYCHVKDEHQLGILANQTGYSVKVVEPNSDFDAGRSFTGTCK